MSADTRARLSNYLVRKARRHQRKAKRHHKRKDRAAEHQRSAAWLYKLAQHVRALDPEDWRLVMIGASDWRSSPDDVAGGCDGFHLVQEIGSHGPVDLDEELHRFAKACVAYVSTRSREDE
jgi:hypothetical protein